MSETERDALLVAVTNGGEPRVVRQLVQVDQLVAFDPWHPGAIYVCGEERAVTLLGWRLFVLLASEPSRVWQHAELYERLWGEPGLVHTSSALRTLVSRLRRVLPGGYLVNVARAGYRLLPDRGAREASREHRLTVHAEVMEAVVGAALPGETVDATLLRLIRTTSE